MTRYAITSIGPDAKRAPRIGHIPLSSPAWSKNTNNSPNDAPESNATITSDAGVRTCGTPTNPPISATDTIAIDTPTSASTLGRSPIASPTATGTTAETTPVIGATTVIAPLASA